MALPLYHAYLLVILSIACRVVSQSTQTCYWPSGQTATPDQVSCSTGASQCCSKGSACLSNGLCFSPSSGTVYRGSCTDKLWGISSCPNYCKNNFQYSTVQVMLCPPDANGNWRWWCGSDYTAVCQDVNANTTFFEYGSNAYIFDVVGNGSASSASATSSTASTHTVPPITSGDECASSATGMVSKSVTIGVGVGIGIPLALLSCALGCLLFWERRKRFQAEKVAVSSGYSPVANDEKEQSSPYELEQAPPELDSRPVE